MKKLLFCLVMMCCGVVNAYAQSGKIIVNIFDAQTGDPLIGATAKVAGTAQGGVADLDGNATIAGLPAGTYDVEVSYISYDKKTITGLALADNEAKKIQVGLAEEAESLAEVVVTAQALQNTENALITIQRNSPKLMDAISAEQFSVNGDNDAAAAVKRVVGVTVEGGKHVYVRGLGDRYSRSTLNGAEVPSLDPDKNSVEMDLFPSNLIDNIIVYKTFSPDLSGEFAGGLVDIATKDFPNAFTMQVSASAGYNFQSTLNNNYLTHGNSSTEWLGYNRERALPQALADLSLAGYPGPYEDNQQLDELTKSFDNVEFTPATEAPPVNHSLNFSLGNQAKIFNTTLGYIAGLTYSRDYDYYDTGMQRQWERSSNLMENLDNNLRYELRDSRATDAVAIGAMFNTSLKISNNHKVGLNLMHNRGGEKETRVLQGPYEISGPLSQYEQATSRVLSYYERALTTGQLKGNHAFAGLSDLKVDWLASYTQSYMDQPDLKYFFDIQNIDPNNETDTTYSIQNARTRPSRFFRHMEENVGDYKLNITLPVRLLSAGETRFKTGVSYTAKERTFREYRYEYFVQGRERYNGDIEHFLRDENLGLITNPTGGNQYLGTYLGNFTQQPNNYDGDETVAAAYLMVETPVAKALRMTAGARYEITNRAIYNLEGTEIGKIDQQDLLPALSLTYEVTKQSNLRFAYGRTLARPTFREFAPLTTFSFAGGPNVVGNPQLDRTLIDNLDLRWELFPGFGEYVGVSVFFKHFSLPIEQVTNPKAGGEVTLEYTFVNVADANLFGAEVEVKKTLGFISPLLENFKVSGNVSLVRSAVQLSEDESFTIGETFGYTDNTRPMYNQSP
ncbi:MAG: TonB-dependent receptor, partial [Bacteroidetes bacterium]|nr:TonB-dependent receptor [Bacteroidota bacterium]